MKLIVNESKYYSIHTRKDIIDQIESMRNSDESRNRICDILYQVSGLDPRKDIDDMDKEQGFYVHYSTPELEKALQILKGE